MKDKITLKQIAKEMGVSISTVSKALKDSYEIGEETKEKIRNYAKANNYRPNRIALSLKDGRTRTIAVILPEIVHHFFSQVVDGIEKIANKAGYNVLVCSSNESFAKEVVNMDTLAHGKIDGFIISLSKETQMKQDYHHIQEVINQGMPIVMFDRVVDEIDCDKVVVNDAEAVEQAVDYLWSNGRRRIGLISSLDYLSVGRLRTEGYIQSLLKHGLNPDEGSILKINEFLDCEAPIQEFMEQNDFDAILGVNEIYAITAMKILQRKGLHIPQQVEIIGFSDGILSRYSTPSLTSVDQHGKEMGETAAHLLLRRLADTDDEPPQTRVIPTSLKFRGSSGRPANFSPSAELPIDGHQQQPQ
ncbi:MAG: LacI family DNA-binding transcriptional regulator [Bacteroidota bacterium]